MTQTVWNPYPTQEAAKEYEGISFVQESWAVSSLARCDFLENSNNILDVGCGTGNVTAKITELVPHAIVSGIDVSPDMIEIAKEKQTDTLEFEVGDAMQLPFKEDHFDTVFAFNSLHWVREPETAMKEIHRILRPGGNVVIVAPDSTPKPYDKSAEVGKVFGSIFGNPKWQKELHSLERRKPFSASYLQESLSDIGFQSIKISQTLEKVVFTNSDQVENWISSSMTFIKQIADRNTQRELAKEIAGKWLEIYPPSDDGTISMYGPKLEAIAEKPC